MRMFGDPNRFGIAFETRQDPDSGGDPLARASFGALQFWVAGRNLTAGRAGDGRAIDAAEVPLAPVVQWLLHHWDPLLHEERLPRPSVSITAAAWRMDSLRELPEYDDDLDALMTEREEWWQRHGLGAALPEFRMPDLHLRRTGDSIEVSWDDREWRSVPGGVRLIEPPGAALLPADEVAQVLHEWGTACVEELRARDDCRTFVDESQALLEAAARPASVIPRLEWAAGQHIANAAIHLRRLAGVTSGAVEDTVRALLGVDRDPVAGLVTPLTVPVLLFRSARPDLSNADLAELLRLATDIADGDGKISTYQCPDPPPADPQAATQDGYDRALTFRDEIGLPDGAPLVGDYDLELVIMRQLEIDVVDVQLDDRNTDGIAIRAAGRVPRIAVNLSSRFAPTRWGRRMTLAHELCHLMHDVDENGRVGIASNPWAPLGAERRANAFAAMLLLPPAALAGVLPSDSTQWTVRLLTDAMSRLGVGKSTLTWHLYNLRWITSSEREFWVDAI